jgi:hypothetical protein
MDLFHFQCIVVVILIRYCSDLLIKMAVIFKVHFMGIVWLGKYVSYNFRFHC